jgi:hypothetical protein
MIIRFLLLLFLAGFQTSLFAASFASAELPSDTVMHQLHPAAPGPYTYLSSQNMLISVPGTWQRMAVEVEILNGSGRLVRKITESRAASFIVVSLADLPVGAYTLRTRCRQESLVLYAILTGHS